MRVGVALLTAVLVAAAILSAPVVLSQPADSDAMHIETNMNVSGLGPLDCTGTIKIKYTGDAAASLRLKVFSKYDSEPNYYLDAEETRMFLADYANSLVGKTYWGITIRSTTDFLSLSSDALEDRTSGLVYSDSDSPDDLSFSMSFDGSGLGSAKLILTAQGAVDVFCTAANETVGYDFAGTLVIDQRMSTLGIGSILGFEVGDGKLDVVRTIVGFIAYYEYEGDVQRGGFIEGEVRYETFSAFENQQVAFVLVVLGALLVLRMPGRGFMRYKMLHARKFRKYAKPLKTVWYVAIGLTAFLVVIYVFPTLFLLGASGNMIYTAYLLMIVPAVVIAQFFATRWLYGRAALEIPEEMVVEVKQAVVEPEEGAGELLCKACYRPIEAGLDMYRCGCGSLMHVSCADRVKNCPSCGEVLFPERTRSIQCRSCGESFMYSGGEDPYSVQCTKCGAFQEEVKAGKNYLVVDQDPRNAYSMIRSMAVTDRPVLCLTTEFPGKIRSDYNLDEPDVEIKWLSDSTTDIDNVNPSELDGEVIQAVSTFLQTTKSAGVLLDGIDRLIELNGFDKVMVLIRRINDLAVIHGSTIVLSVDKGKLPQGQFREISDEFDEIHDYL